MKKTCLMVIAVVAACVVGAAEIDFADLREDFRAPKGAVRENTGPLFWMHGTETEAQLREYVRRVADSGQGGREGQTPLVE